ncbi:hypothetical protein [Natribacillus halophilus]|uniref:Uncharacterized protein n=1 Tax=Natribacillus halophilus TaxID=549003 RepID=A0A1G8JF67_9BACI|nr:hypothetical protein [Natribacillus halophilus]SDI29721.1 hypothetical protein SAMN04488123_101193 [Natribacillus halophilus]
MILDYSKRFGVVLLFFIVLLMVMNGLMFAMSANDGQQANAMIMVFDLFHFWTDPK